MLAGVLCLNPWHIIAVPLWCDAAKSIRYQVGDASAAGLALIDAKAGIN